MKSSSDTILPLSSRSGDQKTPQPHCTRPQQKHETEQRIFRHPDSSDSAASSHAK